jgi:hypothetical protein
VINREKKNRKHPPPKSQEKKNQFRKEMSGENESFYLLFPVLFYLKSIISMHES